MPYINTIMYIVYGICGNYIHYVHHETVPKKKIRPPCHPRHVAGGLSAFTAVDHLTLWSFGDRLML